MLQLMFLKFCVETLIWGFYIKNQSEFFSIWWKDIALEYNSDVSI